MGEERRLLSASVINQMRFGLVRTRELADNTGAVPALAFFPGRMNGTVTPAPNITTIGANQLNPFDILQRRYSVADDFYVSRGSHSVSFGGSFDRLATDINAPFQWGGVWTFTSLQTFLQNQPATKYIDIYTAMLGPDQKPNPALFVQDQIHLSGLGYEILRREVSIFLSSELHS